MVCWRGIWCAWLHTWTLGLWVLRLSRALLTKRQGTALLPPGCDPVPFCGGRRGDRVPVSPHPPPAAAAPSASVQQMRFSPAHIKSTPSHVLLPPFASIRSSIPIPTLTVLITLPCDKQKQVSDLKFFTILWWCHSCCIFITMLKVRLFRWCCVCCIVLLTLCIIILRACHDHNKIAPCGMI